VRHGGKHCTGLGKQPLARAGQPHVPGRTVEQHDAELALEASDLLADRCLDDMQAFGGAAEPAFLGDGEEVLQLSQLHVNSPDSS
jgi:hypothetical protein